MKKACLLILFITSITTASAQFNPNRLTIGGGLGAQFGDYTLVNIAPQIGYNFSNYINAGAGFTYTHYSNKYSSYKQTNNYFGANLYAKIYPIPYLVLMVQPEINRMWQTVEARPSGEKSKTEEVIPVCLVGGGVRFGPVTAMIQYDLVQNGDSPYGNKLFYSVGYAFSLGR